MNVPGFDDHLDNYGSPGVECGHLNVDSVSTGAGLAMWRCLDCGERFSSSQVSITRQKYE